MAEKSINWTAGILVVDDRVFVGEKKNNTGSVLWDYLESHDYHVSRPFIIPSDKREIVSVLTRCIYQDRLHLILVSGGIGLTPLDVTLDAILEVVERRLPGMEQGLRDGLKENQVEAMLFQGVVGIAGNSLIVALPFSPETSKQCLIKIEPAIGVALRQISQKRTKSD